MTAAVALAAFGIFGICAWMRVGDAPIRPARKALLVRAPVIGDPEPAPSTRTRTPTLVVNVPEDRAGAPEMDGSEGLTGLWAMMERLKEVGPDRFRGRAIRATAAYLGLRGTKAEAFEPAAESAVQLLLWALKDRMEAAAYAPDGDEDAQARWSREADERYDAQRTAAIARLEGYLEVSPRHLNFREDLATWASTLRAASEARE